LQKAKEWSDKAVEISKSDNFLSLKFRLASKARVLKKTGFFVESLAELNILENELEDKIKN